MSFIAHKQRSATYDQGFFDRCVGLWLGLESGHMGADMYQHHAGIYDGQPMSGVTTWNNHATYGTFPRFNKNILLSGINDIAAGVTSGIPIVEYGPSETTAQLVEAVKSKIYIPIDSSTGIIEHEKKLISLAAQCEIRPILMDFFEANNLAVIDRPALGVLLGATISNIPGPVPKQVPQVELTMAFRNLMKPLPYGGYFLVSMDANQNDGDIQNLYNEKYHRLFGVNFLYRIASEIPTQGFNPDYFEYHPVWHKQCGLLAHTVRATRSQHFTFGEGPSSVQVVVNDGDIFHYNNSFKYEPGFFEDCASKTGLKIIKKWEDESSIKLYLFQIPPALKYYAPRVNQPSQRAFASQ